MSLCLLFDTNFFGARFKSGPSASWAVGSCSTETRFFYRALQSLSTQVLSIPNFFVYIAVRIIEWLRWPEVQEVKILFALDSLFAFDFNLNFRYFQLVYEWNFVPNRFYFGIQSQFARQLGFEANIGGILAFDVFLLLVEKFVFV